MVWTMDDESGEAWVTEDEDRALPSDDDTRYLDDHRDRRELRDRYYGLLQELRVVLPGVQVLLAFLLTVPFAPGFAELDTWGRRAYETALMSAMFSVVFLVGPTFLHRFGDRRARRDRLLWSIRFLVVGLVLLGLALVSAMWAVARYVFDNGSAFQLTVPVVAVMAVVWFLLPLRLKRRGSREPLPRAADAHQVR
jgi:drug/metabolite transporter (DMT)-like permease